MPRTSRRPTTLPVTTAPSAQYGDRAEEQVAQRALPMAPGPTPAPQGLAAAPGGLPAGPQAPPQLADVMAQAAAHNGPGDRSFTRPTERPNEPVTHGLPVGPGAGPEALTGVGAATRNNTVEQGTLKNLLTNMAASPGATSAIQDLAARANAGVM